MPLLPTRPLHFLLSPRSHESSGSPLLVFTDGGAIGNPGPGGYGVVIRDGDGAEEFSQGFRHTTNNRMELLAVIEGLRSTVDVGQGRDTVVYSDSRYVVDAVNKKWLQRWQSNGWRTRGKKSSVKNIDLWKRLLTEMSDRRVEFRWVKGHAGNPDNERCDELVRDASGAPVATLEVDAGFEGGNSDSSASELPLGGGDMSKSVAESRSTRVAVGETKRGESKGGLTAARTTRAAVGDAKRGGSADVLADLGSDTPSREFSHIDESGAARMVDVSPKGVTTRRATARCDVMMSDGTLSAIRSGGFSKGDVLGVARVAGIQAAKRTAELIPMCHQIPLSHVQVEISELESGEGLSVEATARATSQTGVEMEALTAASVAALTVYDMCKSAERGIRITDLRLVEKTGGVRGDYRAE